MASCSPKPAVTRGLENGPHLAAQLRCAQAMEGFPKLKPAKSLGHPIGASAIPNHGDFRQLGPPRSLQMLNKIVLVLHPAVEHVGSIFLVYN